MHQLDAILSEATAAIDAAYFQLAIHGGNPVYRERVYCYELYHQMRSRWPKDTPFWLNGEIDKAAHPILTELGAAYAKPDFLIHTPGAMAGNHAIMEVKPAGARSEAILEDIEKLCLFTGTVGYQRAIYLFYGYGVDEGIAQRANELLHRLDNPRAVEIWIHRAPNEPAGHIATLPVEMAPRGRRARVRRSDLLSGIGEN